MDKKVKAVLILVCAVIFCCFAGCSSDPDITEASSEDNSGKTSVQPEYDTFEVGYKTLRNNIRLDGVLRQGNKHQLYFNVSGCEVSRVHVQIEDYVENGDILAELDTTELEKMLELKKMLRRKVLLKMEELKVKADIDGLYDEYSAELVSLELETIDGEISEIQKKISDCVLVSPVSGSVSSIDVVDGDISQLYRPVIEITVGNSMYFIADPVTITDAYDPNAVNSLVNPAGIEKGMQGVLRYDAGNGDMKEIICKVQSIRFPLIEASRSGDEGIYKYRRQGKYDMFSQISVQAEPDENAYLDLPDNTKAILFLDTGIEKRALAVPADSVYQAFNERNVNVLERVKVTERVVVTGILDEENNLVEILEGLSEGELVVLDP